ncbi:MAG: divergent polysaccharide deacetylase family protein, partial [Deltaproteobacteria bacterium]|nr:divergent polysaccharide deacetylase family protein [Deltaproteobacteria bacterium]
MRRFYRRRLSQLLQKLMIPLGFVLMGLGAGVMAGILNEDVSGIPRSHRVIPPLALPADLSLPPSGAQILRLTAAGAPGSSQTPPRPARSPEAAPALRTALTTPRQPGARSPQEDPFQPGFNAPVPLERPRSAPLAQDGRPRPASRGRLALVIDDIGYNLGALATLLNLGAPITYSIIPGLVYTRSSARMIQDQGGEFIIHMPMEPLNYPREDPGENALMISQDVGEIRHRLEAYLS